MKLVTWMTFVSTFTLSLASFLPSMLIHHFYSFKQYLVGYLSLSENELEGSLPTEIVQMTSLSLFFVDGNKFEGTIPSGIEKMTELGSFWLCMIMAYCLFYATRLLLYFVSALF